MVIGVAHSNHKGTRDESACLEHSIGHTERLRLDNVSEVNPLPHVTQHSANPALRGTHDDACMRDRGGKPFEEQFWIGDYPGLGSPNSVCPGWHAIEDFTPDVGTNSSTDTAVWP